MSQPSFKLSKKGSTWWADGALPSGRPFHIDCGTGSRDRAEGVAEIRLRAKLASSKGSRERWQKFHRERAAASSSSSATSHHVVGEASASSAPPPSSATSSPPARAGRPTDDELRAKLLHLGDVARPAVAPDKVIEPDGVNEGIAADSETHDEDPPLDNEGSELIASLLAKGLTLGVVWVANRPLAKRKPPMRGEPHEKGLEWFHDGADTAPSSTNGHTPAPAAPAALAVTSAVGVFGVEQKVSN